MLQQLTVTNFTLIESLDIGFGRGLNIITGETGAGKSIIVDALLLLFGERGSAEYVRKGANKAVIEGTFNIGGNMPLRAFLREHDFDADADELMLRREISERGTSRSFINDTPASLNIVRELGNVLVDFHGQHEHQSLLKAEAHVNFLDNFDEVKPLLAEYHTAYSALKSLLQQIDDITRREHSLREQEEFRRFQLQELDQLNPQRDEEETLEQELSLRENAEQLHDLTYRVASTLYEAEDSIRDRLVSARGLLEELAGIDSNFHEYHQECQSAIVIVDEIAKFAQSYRENIEFDPERLDELRYRLQQLSRCRKKYGSWDDVFAKWDELKRDAALTENFEEEIRRMREQSTAHRVHLGTAGEKLSRARKEVAARVEKTIIATLQHLGMPHIRFAVNIEREEDASESSVYALCGAQNEQRVAAYPQGLEQVEFLIAANPGEELKPLARIASGGEISRVMLALKTALAESDKLPMMVFDEIDTGISGRIAQKVGKTMKELSRHPQIIAITHQPQIAALADTHIMVEKRQTATTTRISAIVLSEEEQIYEVARLLSGEEITDAALQSARELVQSK